MYGAYWDLQLPFTRLFFREEDGCLAWEAPLESALRIKHSVGLQRGKNDKVDAERIAFYAYRNQDSVKLWQATRPVIKELKTLTALRTRLINAKKQLKSSLQESEEFLGKALQKKMQRCCQHSLKALENDLTQVNKQLDELIRSDEELNRLFNLVTSVEGVGAVTAREVIVTTIGLSLLIKDTVNYLDAKQT